MSRRDPAPGSPRRSADESRPEPRTTQACTRCRSRKVRCDGVHPCCKTCSSASAECVWPTIPNRRGRRAVARATVARTASVPDATGIQSRRQEGPVTASVELIEDFSKGAHPTASHGQEVTEEINVSDGSTNSMANWLCYGIVLPDRRGMAQMWEIFLRSTYVEVFGIFHRPTITSQILRGQLSPELALGICMHAARFRTIEIAKYGSPRAAADFYGDAAAKYLLSRSSRGTLDFIIALLLLALHEFSMKRGKEAWFHLGIAIREIFSLDLGKEVSSNRLTVSPLYAPWKIRECRRRCFWSAFIVERVIASGNHAKNVLTGSPGLPRHHLIDLEDVNIQLPSTESDFMFFRPVLTHDSAELGDRRFPSPLPPGDNTATFGHMVKVCKIWGEISRWAFAEGEIDAEQVEMQVRHAYPTLIQWGTELPERSKWNFENYSAHSIPGVALGCSFVFMHLIGAIGHVMLGLKLFECLSEDHLMIHSRILIPGQSSLDEIPRSVLSRALESAKFVLDISNDPTNLLGTPFLDYALHLSSLLVMKEALLTMTAARDQTTPRHHPRQPTAPSFLHQVFAVYKRRIHYWQLTRAYSRVLRDAYSQFARARDSDLRTHSFQTSIEYGSIENMEIRDAETDDEARNIAEIQSRLLADMRGESCGAGGADEPAAAAASGMAPSGLDPAASIGEILDIDSMLAAQEAASAIEVSLSTSNDRWWNDLFGNEPMNMDYDLLLQM